MTGDELPAIDPAADSADLLKRLRQLSRAIPRSEARTATMYDERLAIWLALLERGEKVRIVADASGVSPSAIRVKRHALRHKARPDSG